MVLAVAVKCKMSWYFLMTVFLVRSCEPGEKVKNSKRIFLFKFRVPEKRIIYFLRFIFPAIAAFKMASAVFLESRTVGSFGPWSSTATFSINALSFALIF